MFREGVAACFDCRYWERGGGASVYEHLTAFVTYRLRQSHEDAVMFAAANE